MADIRKKEQIAFIGIGNMGEALIRGIIAAGLYPPDSVIGADPDPVKRKRLEETLGIRAVANNREAVAAAGIVVLAVKPQTLPVLLEEIAGDFTSGQLLVSILAGITTVKLEEEIDADVAVVRVMPNTPSLVKRGMAAICGGRYASEKDMEKADRLISSVGRVIVVSEELMNAVTAVSGSGPAYVFFITELLARAARKLGLPDREADLLARETVIGAGKLLAESGESPGELRRKVTSPGGTTEAAIGKMEADGLAEIILAGAEAARRRGVELGG